MFHIRNMFHILEASGERLVVIRSLRQTILRQQLWFPSQKPLLLHTAVGGEGWGVRVKVRAAGDFEAGPSDCGSEA